MEDMPFDSELVGRELKRSGMDFERLVVDNKADYTHALTEYAPNIILSDHSLPSFNSLEALGILKDSGLNIPFILVTATVSEEFAVNVIKEGATDYILKDRMQRLPGAIMNAIEKNKLEAEREQAFQELNLLFNTIGESFFSRDMLRNQLVQVSPACEQIYGYTATEFLNNPELWEKITHPEDRHIYLDNFQKFSEGQTVISEYRIIHKHFGERWVESKMMPLLNDQHKLIRLYGVTRDITDRKLAEQQIREQHLKLQEVMETQADLLNALPARISLLNGRGRIRAVNGAWRKKAIDTQLGIPNYGVGYSYFVLSPHINEADEESVKKINKGIMEVISRERNQFLFEYQCNTATEKKWARILAAPLTDQNHNGAVIINSDITAGKLAEESLQQSEANLRTVFENTDLSIILFDTQFRIVSFNSNAAIHAQKLLHKKLKPGKPGLSYFPKERKTGIKKAIAAVQHEECVAYETSFEQADGHLDWFEVKWIGVRGNEKENIGVILTIKNITRAKEAELERGKMTADLLQRNKDLEQFTYIVSHNLRAPLANIIGLATMLKDPESYDTDAAEIVSSLSASANHLDNVILDLNQVLQVKTQSDKIETVSLSQLTEEIKHTLNHLIERERVTLTYDFSQIDELKTFKVYLYSIFQNLIINSIKYKRPETDPVITIQSEVMDNRVCITFKDNGRGIDLDRYQEHIFGLYKRFDQSMEGKGMGLFMVKMQTENLGGTIHVKSKLNEGTIFSVELPIGYDQVF